jgi:hypothetical protein
MPISHDRYPKDAFNLVHGILSSRASASTFGLQGLTAADPRTLSVAMPHRVELLDLRDVRRGAIRRSRRATAREKKRGECWRFLILQERAGGSDDVGAEPPTTVEAIAAATAVRDRPRKFREAEPFRFGGLNQGPFVAETERAIRRAEALPEVTKGAFEAVLLVVPALYVTTLWLQDLPSREAGDDSGEADLLLPMPNSNPALKLAGPLPAAAFLKALRGLP